jgi:anti-sigma regulatory factor (Ser/Thr protein kinase)
LNERGRCTACHLEGGTESIRTAREHVRGFLSDAEPTVSDGTMQDVLLAVSELVTNAVRHAPGPCTLEVALDGGLVRIGVSDTSSAALVFKPPQYNGLGGLGLHMLRTLAGDVETRFHEGGKTVRVCLTRAAK